MQCSCGGATINKLHKVSTKAKITEWLGRESTLQEITLDRDVCNGCGREYTQILSDRKVIETRG